MKNLFFCLIILVFSFSQINDFYKKVVEEKKILLEQSLDSPKLDSESITPSTTIDPNIIPTPNDSDNSINNKNSKKGSRIHKHSLSKLEKTEIIESTENTRQLGVVLGVQNYWVPSSWNYTANNFLIEGFMKETRSKGHSVRTIFSLSKMRLNYYIQDPNITYRNTYAFLLERKWDVPFFFNGNVFFGAGLKFYAYTEWADDSGIIQSQDWDDYSPGLWDTRFTHTISCGFYNEIQWGKHKILYEISLHEASMNRFVTGLSLGYVF